MITCDEFRVNEAEERVVLNFLMLFREVHFLQCEIIVTAQFLIEARWQPASIIGFLFSSRHSCMVLVFACICTRTYICPSWHPNIGDCYTGKSGQNLHECCGSIGYWPMNIHWNLWKYFLKCSLCRLVCCIFSTVMLTTRLLSRQYSHMTLKFADDRAVNKCNPGWCSHLYLKTNLPADSCACDL